MSDFDIYQTATSETATYPGRGEQLGIAYATLGLSGEAGEVAEKVKKHIRDGVELDRDAIAKELGDVLWYVAQLAGQLDLKLSDIAALNLAKLRSRKQRGVLGGDGDNR